MNHRQIFLDTETTGLSVQEGDRVINIACVEMIDGKITGNDFQKYIYVDRPSHPEALEIHGLTSEFLADKPEFAEIADEFLEFINGAEIIIHNSPFDVGFINNELSLIGKKSLTEYCNKITCTRALAIELYPYEFLTEKLLSKNLVEEEKSVIEQRAKQQPIKTMVKELVKNPKFRVHSLDHLCKYYGISLASREKFHGALVDCLLLAEIYPHLQKELALQDSKKQAEAASTLIKLSTFQPAVAAKLSESLQVAPAQRLN